MSIEGGGEECSVKERPEDTDDAATESLEWNLIESDPGVFTELCHRIGAEDVEFKEILCTDQETFDDLKASIFGPILGFIFLFKWQKEPQNSGSMVVDNTEHVQDIWEAQPAKLNLFFAKQVIQNACATQAVLSILLNRSKDVEIGDNLKSLREFSQNFDPYMRGLAVSNSQVIRNAHNSFRAPKSFELERDGSTAGDAFHYVAYTPFEGRLYELDGLKEHPVDLSECIVDNNEWIDLALSAIKTRIGSIQVGSESNELRFSLMAVLTDQSRRLADEAQKLRDLKRRIEDGIADKQQTADGIDRAAVTDIPDDSPCIDTVLLGDTVSKLTLIEDRIEEETEKKAHWKKENARRRQDFCPLVLGALKHLARRGELLPAYKAVQKKNNFQASEQT